MTVLEKQNIISAICHKTQKEAQAILAEFHPVASLPKSREKQITTNHTQIQILINQETNQKLQELKSLYSHQIPDGDLNQLFSLIIDIAIEKHPMNCNRNSKRNQSAINNSTKYQPTQQDDQANQNLPLVDSNDFQIKNDAEFDRKSKAKSEGENDNIAIKIQSQSKYYPRKSLPIV